MDRSWIGGRGFVGAFLLGMATLLLAAWASSEPHDSPIVGSWYGRVTVLEPPPPPTVGEFDSFVTFHADGTVVESRRYYFGHLLETTGHGAWTRDSSGTYHAYFRFGVQTAPPSAATIVGTDNVRVSLTSDPDSATLSGTFISEIRATNDTVLLKASGTYSAERIVP